MGCTVVLKFNLEITSKMDNMKRILMPEMASTFIQRYNMQKTKNTIKY